MTHTDADAPPTVIVTPPLAAAGPDAGTTPAGWRSRWGPLLLTALVGGVVALVSAYVIWPHGTVNLDEIVYVNQGRALSHGHLTLDARTFTPDFRPYLTGVARGRVVFKYQPLWPAVLAVSDVLTGDHRVALVLAGAAAALAFGFLGRELTGRRMLGAITGIGVALSPVFVVNSGTALAYLPSAALSAAAVAAGLRGVRTGRWGWYAGAGAGFGALFFHRPFDAVVTGVPLAVWLLARAVRRRAWVPVVVAGAAAVPFLVLWLAYNRLTTGSLTSPAFGIGAPEDAFGFGQRASWAPVHPQFKRSLVDFTPLRSLHTVLHFGAMTPLFTLGGGVVLGLAVYAAWTGRRDPRVLVLAAIPVLVVGGHFFWWGTLNFMNYGLDHTLGPAYWFGAIGPVAALATSGGHAVYRRWPEQREGRRRGLAWGGAALVLLSTVATAAVVVPNVTEARRIRAHQVDVLTAAPEGSVLVVPGAVDNPFVHAVVPIDLAGARRLQAVDIPGAASAFRLRAAAGDRSVWRWVAIRPSGSLAASPKRFALGEVGEVRVPEVTGRLVPARAGDRVADAWLRTVGDDGDELARVELDPGTGAAAGPVVGRATPELVGDRPVWLALGATLHRAAGGPPEIVEARWPARVHDGQVEVEGPGAGYRFYRLPASDVWSPEDVSDAITATIDGLAPFHPVRTTRNMP